MKVLAFAASNSSKSINNQLVVHAADVLKAEVLDNVEVELLDLNDYEMPIYSSDREDAGGIPDLAHEFAAKISGADALLISYAEHNGGYSAAYKNVFDWTSRIGAKVYQNKAMVILSTSPGAGGARNVLEVAKNSAPHFAADVKGYLSVPSFYDVFDMEAGVIHDVGLQKQLRDTLSGLK